MAQKRLALRVPGQGLPGALASDFQGAGYDSPSPMTETAIAGAVTESFVIEGGQPLHGRVTVAGNKNGVLPILAACVMTSEPVVLHNVPRIRDVATMRALINEPGAGRARVGKKHVPVHT